MKNKIEVKRPKRLSDLEKGKVYELEEGNLVKYMGTDFNSGGKAAKFLRRGYDEKFGEYSEEISTLPNELEFKKGVIFMNPEKTTISISWLDIPDTIEDYCNQSLELFIAGL